MDRARFAFVLSIMWGAAILASIIAVFMTVNGARAEGLQCGNWDEVKAELAGKGFYKVGVGMVNQASAMAILENEGGEHWFLFVVNSNGTACLNQEGAAWVPFPEPEPLIEGKRPA